MKTELFETMTKDIDGGISYRDPNGARIPTGRWPEVKDLKMEALTPTALRQLVEDDNEDVLVEICRSYNDQEKQHGFSSAYRRCGQFGAEVPEIDNVGNVTKWKAASDMPTAPDAGRKYWLDLVTNTLRRNWSFKTGQSGTTRLEAAVQHAINTARMLTKADKNNPVTAEQMLKNSGLTNADLQKALKLLNKKA